MLQLRTDMVRSVGAAASLRGVLRLGAPRRSATLGCRFW